MYEISLLDKEIEVLSERRNELFQRAIELVCPFVPGDTVTYRHGTSGRRRAVVVKVLPPGYSFDGKFYRLRVRTLLKSGGRGSEIVLDSWGHGIEKEAT